MSQYRYYFFPAITLHRLGLFLLFTLAALLCDPADDIPAAHAADRDKPLEVMVSILPQEYFVNRIGGDRVQVKTLVQPGHSPHTYAPTPKQMAALATSKIYFRIGVPFENGLIPKLARSFPHLTIINQSQGINMIPMEESSDDHDHDHGDLDPHTWLDPLLALKQSIVIRDTLARFDPGGAAAYETNFTSLARDLTQLDEQLREILQPVAGKSIYVFHPAYGYFCRTYGLIQKAIKPDSKEPGARYLARFIEEAKKENIRVIFVQPQFSEKTAQTIARSVGASVVDLDPLAADYLENMRYLARQLAFWLGKPGP
jgi:zinc transport system substrate-binding protein